MESCIKGLLLLDPLVAPLGLGQHLLPELKDFPTEILQVHPVVRRSSIFSYEALVDAVCRVRYHPLQGFRVHADLLLNPRLQA